MKAFINIYLNMRLFSVLIANTLIASTKAQGVQCSRNEYQCFDGQCIPLYQLCDYNIECRDGSDETDCHGECLVRHDVFGIEYIGNRQITKDGRKCETKCRGIQGIGVVCNTTNLTLAYCYVPHCENQRISSSDCDFFANFCGWTVTSNSTFESWVSEDNIGHIRVRASNKSMVVLSSPVILVKQWIRYDWITFDYTVNKENNVYWTTQPWFPNDIFHIPRLTFDDDKKLTKLECKRCRNAIQWRFYSHQYQTKIYLFFFMNCQNECNVTFDIHSIKKEDEMTGKLEPMEQCRYDEFPCSYSSVNCIPIESILDLYEDCRHDDLHSLNPNVSCKDNQIQCTHSKTCIPISSSTSLKAQCLSNRTELPYEKTSTKCPASFECKRRISETTVDCLSSSEICDGVPNCPHWDDEINCQKACPLGCYSCKDKQYRCSPSSLGYISNGVAYLDLSGHALNLTHLCSLSILTLTHLNVSHCGLSDITCLFDHKSFPSLRVLDVSYNNITIIQTNYFPFKKYGTILYLDGNPLTVIRTFKNWNVISIRNSSIENLRWNVGPDTYLYLHFNVEGQIENAMESHYRSNFYVSKLFLSGNKIKSFWFLIFCSIVVELDLSNNEFSNLTKFPYIPFLKILDLHKNNIERLESTHLKNIKALEILHLGRNKLRTIGKYTFIPVRDNLQNLSLNDNVLSYLHASVFRNISNLKLLDLQGNVISYLDKTIFQDLVNLRSLFLQNNKLSSLPKELFQNLNVLQELNIAGNFIMVYDCIFKGLGILKILKVESFTLCCARPPSVLIEKCIAESKYITSCSYLLEPVYLSVSVWYIALLLVVFNLYKLITLMKRTNYKFTTCDIFMSQYMLSDIFMGLYLIIIGYFDVYYKGSFGFHYHEWIQIPFCTLADILLTMSIQSSTFLTLNISLYGTHTSMRGIFKIRRVHLKNAALWILSFTCAFPSIFTKYFYVDDDHSEISKCFAFPIANNVTNARGSAYSVVLFLGFNPLIYCISLMKELASTLTRIRNRTDTRFLRVRPKKMDGFIINSFIRYILLCMFGYLALCDIDVMPRACLVIFVVPVNSILNVLLHLKLYAGY